MFENNSIISTFLYALSSIFPEGEKFFIHSVRHYRPHIKNPELLRQVRGFIGQEAHHSQSHIQVNKTIEQMGFPISELASHTQVLCRYIRISRSDKFR